MRNSNRYYVRPIFSKIKTKDSLFLGSSKLFFNEIELITRGKTKTRSKFLKINEIKYLEPDIQRDINKRISNITKKRKKLGKFNFGQSLVMGILNVTPDSFFDGGKYLLRDNAIEQFKKLIKEGADIIDIGGESTRPGSKEITVNEEISRIIPIISQIRKKYKKEFISVDTRKSQVMKEACKFDINLINDVSGLRFDKNSKNFLNSNKIPFVLMHSISTPEKMQKNIKYKDVLLDIYDFFEKQISLCEKNGISKSRIIIDPGIGFGKTLQQNLKLISNIALFHSLGLPVLLGSSRKSFIGKIEKNELYEDRLGGSIATVMHGLAEGVQIFRVHDVYATKQSIKVYSKIK